MLTFDAGKNNRGDVFRLYKYMSRFNPKRVTNLTDKQFKNLEKVDNINKIDIVMYSNE